MLATQNLIFPYSNFNWFSTAIGTLAFLEKEPEGLVQPNKLTQTSFIATDS